MKSSSAAGVNGHLKIDLLAVRERGKEDPVKK